jgi:kynurenine formamidase
MVANTGTYVDSPFHRFADGKDLSELPLESLAHLDAVVVDATERATGPEAFRGLRLRGRAVLIRTGWDRHWRTDAYFEGHPFLTRDAARLLADEGAALVGIDSYNIDDTDDWARPAHTVLLGAGIPICEHMTNLAILPNRRLTFSAVPVKIAGFGTFPVRAYAAVEG